MLRRNVQTNMKLTSQAAANLADSLIANCLPVWFPRVCTVRYMATLGMHSVTASWNHCQGTLQLLSLFVIMFGILDAQGRPESPLMRALDTDHDGVISAAEMEHAAAALAPLDTNHDGALDQSEVRPARRASGAASSEFVQTLMAFDRDHDGKISKSELPERMQPMLERGDANHDGFLTADEIQKLAEAQQPPEGGAGPGGRGEGFGGPGRGTRGDPLFAALDTDHDGVLSAKEIAGASAALKQLDRNGDGQLTPDEFRPQFGPGPRREMPPRDQIIL